jgi:hypothetical protein
MMSFVGPRHPRIPHEGEDIVQTLAVATSTETCKCLYQCTSTVTGPSKAEFILDDEIYCIVLFTHVTFLQDYDPCTPADAGSISIDSNSTNIS